MSNSELYKFIKDEEKLFYLLFPDLGFEKCVSKQLQNSFRLLGAQCTLIQL